jgi:hypothetical protein
MLLVLLALVATATAISPAGAVQVAVFEAPSQEAVERGKSECRVCSGVSVGCALV